jgi:Ca2+-transporting ATPase
MQTHTSLTISPQHLISALLLTGLLFLGYLVLSKFFLTLIWAFILAYVTGPLYQWLDRKIGNHATISAAIMTALLTLTMLVIVFWFATLLQEELKDTYQALVNYLAQEHHPLPNIISNIPWLGTYLQERTVQLTSDPAGLAAQLTQWGRQWLRQFAGFLGGIGNYTLKTGVLLVTVFFCYRDGQRILSQLQYGVIRFLGDHRHIYMQAIGETTKAVVYGFVLAAMVQGSLAGIGFAVAGVQAPVLLGATTALLALVPFGATLVWVPVGLTLLLESSPWAGIGLLLWGTLVVSTVDNVIRPLVISGASQIPFLVVMFGVLGGLHTFGIIGIFLGPIVLAVLLAVWQAWLTQQGMDKLSDDQS